MYKLAFLLVTMIDDSQQNWSANDATSELI